jgi:DNA-binding Lrp family transcriptional regulator
MSETMEMSMEELSRIKIIERIIRKEITQRIASKMLGISDRQVRNLMKRMKNEGARGLISKKRGMRSNRCFPADLREKTLNVIRSYYPDFGPKLASEYLKSVHKIEVSHETVRQWMIQSHLWAEKGNPDKKRHLPRKRRSAFGELIQIDGSHHDWFEGRSPPCVLMVFIDDATSMITSLHFSETENLEAYYQGLKNHITTYGIPLSAYGDRCSVLTPRQVKGPENITQFHRALKELKCELILARSPQAKGRVERANRTLQDRLVKMMRIRGINTMEEAKEILEEYRAQHNQYFSQKPSELANAHRPLEGICLEDVLSILETRTLDKDFVLQFENSFYQILSQDKGPRLFKRGKVEIRQLLTGEIRAFFQGRAVKMMPLSAISCKTLDEKQIMEWKPRAEYHPRKNHPYKIKLYRNRTETQMLQEVV